MTVSSVPNDMIKQPLESTQPAETTPLTNQLSYADFQSVFPTSTKGTGEATSGQFLSFDNDIYAKSEPKAAANQSSDANPANSPATASPESSQDLAGLNKNINTDISNLSADEKALKSASTDKSSSTYKTDLDKLDKDEQSLHTDVMGFLKDSVSTSNYKDFSATLEADHPELKSIAEGLDHMGLQPEASETTAYYPLSHYQHYFDKVGSTGPGGPGGPPEGGYQIKPPTGSTNDTGLETASAQHVNTIPEQIGGTGGVTSATATQDGPASDQTVTYSETGGGTYVDAKGQTKNNYSDALWRADDNSATALGAKQVQLDTTFEMTASQLKNTSEIEKDIVVQKADGTHATIGTQINTKNGDVDFWNSQSHEWVHEGSVTGGKALTADTKYTLQLGATISDDGNAKDSTYTYDYYSLNGNKLDATSNTFHAGISNWQPGVYIQTQVDEGVLPKGSVAGFTESNEQLWISDTNPQNSSAQDPNG
jgi:hypothetical protein